jgi:hypothetical protein
MDVIIVEQYRGIRQLCRIFPEGSTKRVMISIYPGTCLLVRLLLTKILRYNDAPRQNKMKKIKKIVFITLLLVIGVALAFPQPSYSQCYGYNGYCGPGVLGAAGAIVAGAGAAVLGAAGAIVGTVVGPIYGYYGAPVAYGYPRPAYVYPAPAYGYRYPYYGPRPYPGYGYRGYYGPRYYGYYGRRW